MAKIRHTKGFERAKKAFLDRQKISKIRKKYLKEFDKITKRK